MNFPIYENGIYRMREMLMEDANDIFEYYSDRLLMKYTATSPHNRIEDTQAMIHKLSSSFLSGSGIAWAITEKEHHIVIGNIGLYYLGESKTKAAVGYNISAAYQNQGIATWALGNCINFGINDLKIKQILAKCKSVNYASERVMQKCGMHLTEVNKSPFLVDGIYYDIKTYVIENTDPLP
jgi:ribosomal-protein-alanine N-acetyltransferase